MTGRRLAELVMFSVVFSLTAVLPIGWILVTIASFLQKGNAGYDDTVLGLARGLARDVRDLGLAGWIPLSLLLLGVGFGGRRAVRGRLVPAARIVGGGTILALLAAFACGVQGLEYRAARVALFLAGSGLMLAFLAVGTAAWRATRRARG